MRKGLYLYLHNFREIVGISEFNPRCWNHLKSDTIDIRVLRPLSFASKARRLVPNCVREMKSPMNMLQMGLSFHNRNGWQTAMQLLDEKDNSILNPITRSLLGRAIGVKVISLDLIGTILRRDFIDNFWEGAIPDAVALERRWSFRRARRWVLGEYRTISTNDIRWHLPSYWMSRFNLREDPARLLRHSISFMKEYNDAETALRRMSMEHQIIISTNVSRDFLIPALQKLKVGFRAAYSSVSDYSLPLKPPEFYSSVARDLQADPGTILHIGDDPVQDYLNPKRAGLNAILLDRSGRHKKYHPIRSLASVDSHLIAHNELGRSLRDC